MLYLKNLTYHLQLAQIYQPTISTTTAGAIIGPSALQSTLLEILSGFRTTRQVFWREQELVPEHLQQLGGWCFNFQSGISVAVQFRRIALRTSRIRLRAGQVWEK